LWSESRNVCFSLFLLCWSLYSITILCIPPILNVLCALCQNNCDLW
jgi:hypothetical protein